MNTKAIVGGIIAAFLLGSAGASSALLSDLGEFSDVQVYNSSGELLLTQTLEESNPLLVKTQHFLRVGVIEENKNEKGKPGGGGSSDPGTDCESDNYRVTGWHWTAPYSALSASNSAIVSGALGEWDGHTAASISGGASGGNQGTAGVYDGVNQLAWVSLGASTTVAVTTTWSYRGSGEAVESDGQYNTYYPWATNGASNAMDVESVVQHEVGHTFGLDHPSGQGISCLTMYAYVDYGLTHGRTLGDGDILGIKAVYGN